MPDYYFFDITNKVVGNLLDLFNDIKFKQWSFNSSTSQWYLTTHTVPLEIATKSKVMRDFQEQKSGANKSGYGVKRGVNVPRMSLMLTDLSDGSERQTNGNNIIKSGKLTVNSENKLIQKYIGSPKWMLGTFTLNIYTRKMGEFSQIVEQILPMFMPQRSLNIKLIPEIDLNISLPVGMEPSVPLTVDEDMGEEDLRFIESEIVLLVMIPFFPPIQNGNIIEQITANYGTIAEEDSEEITQIQEIFNMYAVNGASTGALAIGGDSDDTWTALLDGTGAPALAISAETGIEVYP